MNTCSTSYQYPDIGKATSGRHCIAADTVFWQIIFNDNHVAHASSRVLFSAHVKRVLKCNCPPVLFIVMETRGAKICHMACLQAI